MYFWYHFAAILWGVLGFWGDDFRMVNMQQPWRGATVIRGVSADANTYSPTERLLVSRNIRSGNCLIEKVPTSVICQRQIILKSPIHLLYTC